MLKVEGGVKRKAAVVQFDIRWFERVKYFQFYKLFNTKKINDVNLITTL